MSELQIACEEKGITITSQHLYVDYSEGEDHGPRDKWACTIHYKDRSATFEYYTGSGHRVLAPRVKRESHRKYVVKFTGDVVWGDRQAIEKGLLILKKEKGKIVGPSVADVLSCLLSDAGAMETTFDDWCSNFGSNNDSLAALNTYLACQRNGSKVSKLLGYALMKELVEKEH